MFAPGGEFKFPIHFHCVLHGQKRGGEGPDNMENYIRTKWKAPFQSSLISFKVKKKNVISCKYYRIYDL